MKSQLYQLVVGSHNELGVEAINSPTEEFQDCPEQLENTEPEAEPNPLVLSLHALQGSQGHNTMRIAAKIGQFDMIILVDSGSTHNFVDSKIAKRGNLPIEPAKQMKIMVANGGSLCTRGLCRAIEW